MSSLQKIKFDVRFNFKKLNLPVKNSLLPRQRAISGVKQLRLEADHSPPLSANVKNVWHYTSSPQYTFMA
jgi:hypothetical protein